MVISREVSSYCVVVLLSEEDGFLDTAGLVLSDFSTVSLESLQDCSLGLTHIVFVTCSAGNAID